MSSEKRYLTLKETSFEYGNSEWTWRLRASKREIESFKPAGPNSKILIAREEIERFLQQGRRPRVEQAVPQSA
jgi:hypothetical protein